MKTFAVLLLAAIGIFFLHACKKEYSYEGSPASANNPDSAIYILSGYPSTCVNTKLSGNYLAGIKLSSDHFITLMVDVSRIGNYSISTNLVNGMSFTGSGKFTKTGLQEISLQGTGTALLKGTNNLLVSAGNTYCSFTITVKEDTPVEFPLDSWQFTQGNKTYRGYFDGALTTIVNGSTVLTLVGLTATRDTAIAILVDIAGSLVVKTGSYHSLTNATFSFFDNLGNNIFVADKNGGSVDLTITIVSYDPATKIITGIFSGNALNKSNQPVPITEGKFRALLNR